MKNKFYNIISKVGKRNFILIIFIFIVLLVTGLYQTFSLYTESEGLSIIDGIKTYSFILNASNTTNFVTIAADSSKYIDITVSNDNEANLKYGIYYSTTNIDDINIGYKTNTSYLPSGVIDRNKSYVVTIRVDNTSDSSVTITFGLKYGFENGGDLSLNDSEYWLDEYVPLPSTTSLVNVPNLDNGNLLPVYYDDTVLASDGTYGVWKKADSTNKNNSWYDYENKKWANAVIISEDASTDYSSTEVDVGTPIIDSDIIAFYVWIPRYKYRVWNINRQGTSQDYYAYPAYSNGIEIEFETGTATTGNVECNDYDIKINGSATYLSDNCKVNDIAVVYGDDNRDFVDEREAWYTHPAFTFGADPITGFWIGKFETSGTIDDTDLNISNYPTILPDVSSLRNQYVSQQFTTAKKFQNYLSSDMDAHMLTNLEWGAVAYLTHSLYGLCNENDDGITCQGVYLNNSSGYYTGRSMGNIATSVTTSTYGTYDYKGYLLDGDGKPIGDAKTSLVASTTGNVTGVYDMSGGAYEYVMGNMVNTSHIFYPSLAGNAWNNTNWYDTTNSALYSKYYNAYSYGTNSSGAIAFNRSRLGDATAEVLGGTSSSSAWKVGSGITGSYSYFVHSSASWFFRGGSYNNSNPGLFSFSRTTGASDDGDSFRSSLS